MQGVTMIENLRPLGDRILVKRLEPETKTAGGIIIPDVAQEKVQTGRIVAIGKGRLLQDGTVMALQLEVGDIVHFGKYAGTEVDNDHVILKEDEVLGVVEQK